MNQIHHEVLLESLNPLGHIRVDHIQGVLTLQVLIPTPEVQVRMILANLLIRQREALILMTLSQTSGYHATRNLDGIMHGRIDTHHISASSLAHMGVQAHDIGSPIHPNGAIEGDTKSLVKNF
jgi:hypothetical protein